MDRRGRNASGGQGSALDPLKAEGLIAAVLISKT